MSSSGYYLRVSADGRRYAIFRWFSPWAKRCTWYLAVLSKGEVEPDAVHDAVLYFNIFDGDKDDTTVAVPESGWKGMSTFSDSLQVKHVKRDPAKRPRDEDSCDDHSSFAAVAPPLQQPRVKTTQQQFDPRDCRYVAPATNRGVDCRDSDQDISSAKRSKYEPPVDTTTNATVNHKNSSLKAPVSASDRLAAAFARMISDMCGREEVSSTLPAQIVEQFDALIGDYGLDMPTTLAVFRLVLDCLKELQRQQARAESVSSGGHFVSQLPCEMPSDAPYDELCLNVVCSAFPLISPSTTKLLLFAVLGEIEQLAPDKLSGGFSVVPMFFICDLANSHTSTPREPILAPPSPVKRPRSNSSLDHRAARQAPPSSREMRFAEDCARFVGKLFPSMHGRDAPPLTSGIVVCDALRRLSDLDREMEARQGRSKGVAHSSTQRVDCFERCVLIVRNLFPSVSVREVETHLRDAVTSLISLGVPSRDGAEPLRCFCELLQEFC
eukprot:gene30222-37395_t